MDFSEVFSQVISNFDFAFMIVINVLTYLLVKIYESGIGKASKLTKRLILLFSILSLTVIYLFTTDVSKHILLNSAILSPVFYSWILKPILDKFGLGYINLQI